MAVFHKSGSHSTDEASSFPNLSMTIRMNSRVSCRLYPDTRPHCLETSNLHKGLVLVIDDKEVIEEGVGFGVPIILYEDETYFSSSADCVVQENEESMDLVKTFKMDTVIRKQIGNSYYLVGDFYDWLHQVFHKIYVTNSVFTPLLRKLIELRKLLGIKTEFVKVKPRGNITIKYEVRPYAINIIATFNEINKNGCSKIIILNEQGASYFREYFDSDGIRLFDDQVEAWMNVNADDAFLSDPKNKVAFSLSRIPSIALLRGREKIRNRFSWIGLSYVLPFSTSSFSYAIKVVDTKEKL